MLIILLIASMLLLGWKSRVFYDFFDSGTVFSDISTWMNTGSDSSSDNSSDTGSTEAARPLYIAVTNDSGKPLRRQV